jgi:hypothetical protein
MLMQLGSRDQLSRALQKGLQQSKRLLLQGNADAVLAQFSQRGIHLKRAEFQNGTGWHRTHSLLRELIRGKKAAKLLIYSLHREQLRSQTVPVQNKYRNNSDRVYRHECKLKRRLCVNYRHRAGIGTDWISPQPAAALEVDLIASVPKNFGRNRIRSAVPLVFLQRIGAIFHTQNVSA